MSQIPSNIELFCKSKLYSLNVFKTAQPPSGGGGGGACLGGTWEAKAS